MFYLLGGLAVIAVVFSILIPALFRVVVPVNEVHIVSSKRKSIFYGRDSENGNTYYNFPAWIPVLGIESKSMPVSVIDIGLENYEAYDKNRLPFVIDIKAFFRVSDALIASERVSSIPELVEQLKSILQGAARSILASNEIEEIMQGRSKFGEMFTESVDGQLKNWGVMTVKSIELMDIRDSLGSKVIANIMEKQKSVIERESRTVVAENNKLAQIAEIEAKREADLKKQEAEQSVGIRTAQKQKEIGIAEEQSKQQIKEQAKVTAEKDMAVKLVENVKQAEIDKEVNIVLANQEKETAIIKAEAELEKSKRDAESQYVLAQKEAESQFIIASKEAEAIKLKGEAEATAKQKMEMAVVEPQITMAKEIGDNQGYQEYLVSIRQIDKEQIVGIEQAKALQTAGIKIIANTGTPNDGINNVMDIFSSKGGSAIGGMLENMANTDSGKFNSKFLSPKETN